MLRTNSKKARENVRAYILENTRGLENETFKTAGGACAFLYGCFLREKGDLIKDYGDWCAFNAWVYGLPNRLFTTYLLYQAKGIVGAILEETPEEVARYSEAQAERLLTTLIFREIKKEIEND